MYVGSSCLVARLQIVGSLCNSHHYPVALIRHATLPFQAVFYCTFCYMYMYMYVTLKPFLYFIMYMYTHVAVMSNIRKRKEIKHTWTHQHHPQHHSPHCTYMYMYTCIHMYKYLHVHTICTCIYLCRSDPASGYSKEGLLPTLSSPAHAAPSSSSSFGATATSINPKSLGPLPSNWEIAYTENNEKYFIEWVKKKLIVIYWVSEKLFNF